LAAGESVLVVVNKDYDLGRPGFAVSEREPNYTSFRVNPNGRLIPVPFSTVSAGHGGAIGPGNPTPSQALVSPDGRLVFDTDTFGTEMESLRVDISGRLEHVASLPTPASEFVPFPLIPNPAMRPFVLGSAVHPTQRVLYAGFIVSSVAGVYTYDLSGNLQFVRSVPAGFGICWVIFNAAGDRVYTSNTLSNTIAVIDTSDPLNPVKIQEFPLEGPPSGSEQMALDRSGEFLYVIGQKTLDIMPPDANELHVLRIGSDGRIAAQTDRKVIPVVPSLPQGVAAR
jgi:DNA-binding beta-propeller fold protein YncE